MRGTERPTVRLPRYTGAETLFLFVDADFGGSANEFCYDAGRLWKRNGSSPTFAPSATALTAQSPPLKHSAEPAAAGAALPGAPPGHRSAVGGA